MRPNSESLALAVTMPLPLPAHTSVPMKAMLRLQVRGSDGGVRGIAKEKQKGGNQDGATGALPRHAAPFSEVNVAGGCADGVDVLATRLCLARQIGLVNLQVEGLRQIPGCEPASGPERGHCAAAAGSQERPTSTMRTSAGTRSPTVKKTKSPTTGGQV